MAVRVLIVEDNKDAADSLQIFLGLLGHEVRVAYTGTDGVRIAAAWVPEVVISDIGLPGLDGFKVAEALRADPATAGARLIAVTGYNDEETRARGRAAGFEYLFVKPADPAELLPLLTAL